MDQTPVALFDAFEQDFRHIINSISEKLEGSGKNQLGGALNMPLCRCLMLTAYKEQRKAALRKVEIELDEADDIVSFVLSMPWPKDLPTTGIGIPTRGRDPGNSAVGQAPL